MHITNIVGIRLTIILVGFVDSQGNINQLELTVFLHVLQEVATKIIGYKIVKILTADL